jgi:hypothetical protein
LCLSPRAAARCLLCAQFELSLPVAEEAQEWPQDEAGRASERAFPCWITGWRARAGSTNDKGVRLKSSNFK